MKSKIRPQTNQIFLNPYIFRAYDIRGLADGKNIDLSEKVVELIGQATAIYLQKRYRSKTIAVGCDNRLTSEKLKKAYIKGVVNQGLKVTDIGLATSPMIYYAVCALNFDSAANITASHNPKQYNGLKIVTKNAHSICGQELQEIYKIALRLKKRNKNIIETTKIQHLNIWPKYLKEILSKVKLQRKLKVAIDSGNGVTGKFAPELFKKLGCKAIPLFCKLDGNFPNHEANPEELKNMQDLIKAVIKNKADLGIGFDGDGDRIGIVDEKRHLYSSDFMLLLLAEDLLKRRKKAKIVFDVKTSQVVINKLKELGAITIMSKTGHSFIENKMKKIKADLAGEVSGHLFFAENYYGFDDAFLAAAKILEIVSKSQRPLSEFFENLRKTIITEEFKAHCPDNKKFKIVKKLVSHFTKYYSCITIDGVRVKFDKKSWGAVRASNTSPNLTLRFEADTFKKLAKIQKITVEELKKYPEISLDWYKKN